MITKYFSEEDLWEAKLIRFISICEEQGMSFVTLEYLKSQNFPAWNVTMVLNLAGYDYKLWYIGQSRSSISEA